MNSNQEKSNKNTPILNKNDIKKLENPKANELVENLENQGLTEDQIIDDLLKSITGKPRCEMSDKDYDSLDNLLDNVLGQKLNNVDKAETFTDEMIETLKRKVCVLRKKSGSQIGGMSGTLIMFALATLVTAVQGINLNQAVAAQEYRNNVNLGKDTNNFPVERHVDVANYDTKVPVIDKEAYVKAQIEEMLKIANAPQSVGEIIWYNLTPENAQVLGNVVIAAGLILGGDGAVPVDFLKGAGAAIAFNKAVEGGRVIHAGADGVKNLGEQVEKGVNNVLPSNAGNVEEWYNKVSPIINAIKVCSDEFKNIYNYNHINGLDILHLHVNTNKYTPEQINQMKRLITLSYLHKSIQAYKRYIDIALQQLEGNIELAPDNVDLPKNARENIAQLKNKLRNLEEKIPGGVEFQGVYDDVYENVSPILKSLNTRVSTTEIDFNPLTKYMDIDNVNYKKVQEFLTPGVQTQIYNTLFGEEYGQQQIFNSLYNEMKEIGEQVGKNAYGTRNRYTESLFITLFGASISLFAVVSFGVYVYFSRSADKKTGGKKTKKKRKRHTNKSKKIRPRKTSNKRVKKHKSKRKHK